MAAFPALQSAIDLMRVPSRIRSMREAPLPEDVGELLKIAAGDEKLIEHVAMRIERPVDTVRQAATFFIEQIMLTASSDAYRVLGAPPSASTAELRRNMALLMKWLHPDTLPNDQREVLASRVTMAWDCLKTAERRSAYDKERAGTPDPLASGDVAPRDPAQPRPPGQLPVPAAMPNGPEAFSISAIRPGRRMAPSAVASHHEPRQRPGILKRMLQRLATRARQL